MNTRIFLLVFFATLTLLSSCRAKQNDDDKAQERPPETTPQPQAPVNTSPSLNLSVSPENRSASNFCGTTTPDLPKNPTPEYRFETSLINTKLSSSEGLKAWIHGAVPQYRQYLATYRMENPEDMMAFFKSQQFSLVSTDPAIVSQLSQMKRHDEVRIKGSIFENGSPIVHIKVTGIEVVERFEAATTNSYAFDEKIFEGKSSLDVFGMIHALTYAGDLGWAMVLETADGYILPVAVDPRQNDLVKTLFRGDIVNVALKIIRRGQGPIHFMTDADKADSFEVTDSILNCHGQTKTVTGTLAKFEKSPAISVDVYAVRYVDSNGLARNFTFFPADGLSEDEFSDVFFAISAKAKEAWDRSTQEPSVVRNFRQKTSIQVIANGVLNVVSSEQANAQIYIRSADQVEFKIVNQ